ncbi:unnamed protein product [Brassica rapa]|uniref:Uncharacterized protein n=1 Tax=Brassica campestris TaxID=3711 RepID=A0A3P5ZG39_BRACM|nr:unnamed protein product [Brassica rapa]VDC71188.1 unnamed protein product [Brassica rapa]
MASGTLAEPVPVVETNQIDQDGLRRRRRRANLQRLERPITLRR